MLLVSFNNIYSILYTYTNTHMTTSYIPSKCQET